MCPGGIHRKYKVYPDISVFAKSMANGYAMSAILGTGKVMQAAQDTFISSTNWTDRVGPAAALSTIKKFIKNKVENHLIKIGNEVKSIWINCAEKNGLKIKTSGLPSLCSFSFDSPDSNAMNTRFTVEMLSQGFLGFRQFKPSYAHTVKDLEKYNQSCNKIFKIISEDPKSKNLKIPLHHTGFQRLTKE